MWRFGTYELMALLLVIVGIAQAVATVWAVIVALKRYQKRLEIKCQYQSNGQTKTASRRFEVCIINSGNTEIFIEEIGIKFDENYVDDIFKENDKYILKINKHGVQLPVTVPAGKKITMTLSGSEIKELKALENNKTLFNETKKMKVFCKDTLGNYYFDKKNTTL